LALHPLHKLKLQAVALTAAVCRNALIAAVNALQIVELQSSQQQQRCKTDAQSSESKAYMSLSSTSLIVTVSPYNTVPH
jgi:hypothetical protein